MTELERDSETTISSLERERALVELVRFDYDATLRTISSVLATATAIRAAGFATWGVLFGLGVQDESWSFCLIATGVLTLFGYLDLMHASIYRRNLHKAIEIEGLLDSYVDRLGINYEHEEAVLTTLARLETHRFGVYRTMRRLRVRDFTNPRPRFLYMRIYPALLLLSATCAAIYGF